MKQLLVIISLLFSTLAWSAPKSDLWPYWNQSDETNLEQVSHQDWQRFLDNYLLQQGQNLLIYLGSLELGLPKFQVALRPMQHCLHCCLIEVH